MPKAADFLLPAVCSFPHTEGTGCHQLAVQSDNLKRIKKRKNQFLSLSLSLSLYIYIYELPIHQPDKLHLQGNVYRWTKSYLYYILHIRDITLASDSRTSINAYMFILFAPPRDNSRLCQPSTSLFVRTTSPNEHQFLIGNCSPNLQNKISYKCRIIIIMIF